MNTPILVAGATGDLGSRLVTALLQRGASVRVLVRPAADAAQVDALTRRGVDVRRVELTDQAGLTQACAGVGCVVSALAGLRDTIVEAQTHLLTAAVAAGVPRFIPSDFCSDYTQQRPGENRNFDLRREFQSRLDAAPIAATSILNGAFGEILTYNIPLLDVKAQQVGYWEDADWFIDFTTMDDVAAYTAAAALDAATPRYLRIASFQLSPRQLAAAAEAAGRGHFALVPLGSQADLTARIERARAANPAGEQQLYADWQQLQYLRSMFTVQNLALDNGRYPDLTWTSAEDLLRAHEQQNGQPRDLGPYSDEELVKQLPGFANHYAIVNGVRLHYVAGGSGRPLVCLPGWPQTWFSFHPVAQELARHYRVVLVDMRGMGSSEKPATGYDKKTMARDVCELVRQLGLGPVSLLGHDIGGMVASSFAYNYPAATAQLIVLDGVHPTAWLRHLPMLPAPGTFTGGKMDGQQPYLWWMAFNQIKELPEQLLAGRFHLLLDYLFAYVMLDERKMTAFDRAVYAAVYNQPENIRAANAWYQALEQDIADHQTYAQLHLPVLGIASYVAHGTLQQAVPAMTTNGRVVSLLDSGHFLLEEQPARVLEVVLGFLNELPRPARQTVAAPAAS